MMRLFFPGLFLACLSAAPAYAGAWTQQEGRGLFIVTASTYSTNSYFDNDGRKQLEGRYAKDEINPYFEYGIADGLTAGGSILLDYATQLPYVHYGVGESELFLRKRLWQGNGFVFSAEPLIKLPAPSGSHHLPVLGSSHPDAALGFNGGYGFTAFGLSHFIDVDTQYRARFGPAKNQKRLNATVGISLAPRWMVMPQLFITRRSAPPHITTFTQSAADDYSLTKFQLSAVYRLTDNVSIQGGGFICTDGKNTGAGNGLLLSVWTGF